MALTSTHQATSLQEHYTNAEDIQHVMSELLGDVTGQVVLDPAVGHGALLKGLKGKPRAIDGVDVNEASLELAKTSQPHEINTVSADFIDLFVVNPLERTSKLRTQYDAVIANPPYGLKMSIEYRKAIKRAHPEVYARESYGLFLHFALQLLKDGGRYVFIVPDTFIHSTNHKPLRKMLVERGAPTHIIQFPSRFFETVNFGYANFCIIAGNARALRRNDSIVWKDLTEAKSLLPDVLKSSQDRVSGEELSQTAHGGWLHPKNRTSLSAVNCTRRLGDLAECRTGIYSGDNGRFFGFDEAMQRVRGAGHPIEWSVSVAERKLTAEEQENGIDCGPTYVPLVKGGHRHPIEQTQWAINWSKDAVNFYRNDKKARLQNSRFYFRKGVGVPMVTSGRISASYFENAIFDQGVVGIFPYDEGMLSFLLVYLNSEFVSGLKRSLNASANNSANYLKKLPVPEVKESVKKEADEIIAQARIAGWDATEDRRRELVSALTNPNML